MGSHQSHLGSQVCPRWDPIWYYGTSCMGSHMGSCQLKLGSRLKFLIASHLGKHIPGRIKPRIPAIPLGILPQISDRFPARKSYLRRDCTWDPANLVFSSLVTFRRFSLSLLHTTNKSCFKNIFRSEFQIKQIEEVM